MVTIIPMVQTQLNPNTTLHCMWRKEGKRVSHIVQWGFCMRALFKWLVVLNLQYTQPSQPASGTPPLWPSKPFTLAQDKKKHTRTIWELPALWKPRPAHGFFSFLYIHIDIHIHIHISIYIYIYLFIYLHIHKKKEKFIITYKTKKWNCIPIDTHNSLISLCFLIVSLLPSP